jgi:hypothetical protein
MLTMTVMMMIMKLNMIIQIFRKYKRAILHWSLRLMNNRKIVGPVTQIPV